MTGEHGNIGGSVVQSRSHGTRTLRYECSDHEQPSEAIVNAVARATGTEASAISPSLYERADPDALDALFADPPGGSRVRGSVTVPFRGVEVEFLADGEILVKQ